MANPCVRPFPLLMKYKKKAEKKNGTRINNPVHNLGLLHFVLRIEYFPEKSVTVPIKQNQPQPIRPNNGEIKTNTIQIISTDVITPQ